MRTPPLSVRAYAGVSSLLHPAVQPFLEHRGRRGKEDVERIGERKGIASLPRPEGALVWLHGASVGEVVSLLPIAEHFTAKGAPVLLTSGTVTSAEVARRRLPGGAFHQYLPVDLPAYVERFLDHWRPGVGVFAESELWPNLVHAAKAHGAHLAIVNARMSERSYRRWRRFPAFIASMLSSFDIALAQTEADAARLGALGAPVVKTIGNLKYDTAPLPADTDQLAAVASAMRERVVFVAASTHSGEEEQIAAAHLAAREALPRLLTVLIPRHPERGAEVAALVARAGLSVCRRSEGGLPDAGTDVYVADTIGELGLFYRQSRLAYLGGSLTPRGGQNPIEPAKLGNGILHGPHVHNFKEVYAALAHRGGAVAVSDGAALGAAVARMLRDPAQADAMAQAALAVVTEMSGANARAIEHLDRLLTLAQMERQAPRA